MVLADSHRPKSRIFHNMLKATQKWEKGDKIINKH